MRTEKNTGGKRGTLLPFSQLAACLRESLHEIETTLQRRYATPDTSHYIEIFNASVQGVSAQELADRFGKSAVAVQLVLRRAKRTIEPLRPPELQGAKRAQTFLKQHDAPTRRMRDTW